MGVKIDRKNLLFFVTFLFLVSTDNPRMIPFDFKYEKVSVTSTLKYGFSKQLLCRISVPVEKFVNFSSTFIRTLQFKIDIELGSRFFRKSLFEYLQHILF